MVFILRVCINLIDKLLIKYFEYRMLLIINKLHIIIFNCIFL